jgi:hypothetical protein
MSDQEFNVMPAMARMSMGQLNHLLQHLAYKLQGALCSKCCLHMEHMDTYKPGIGWGTVTLTWC